MLARAGAARRLEPRLRPRRRHRAARLGPLRAGRRRRLLVGRRAGLADRRRAARAPRRADRHGAGRRDRSGSCSGPVLGGAATETSPELVFSGRRAWRPRCCSSGARHPGRAARAERAALERAGRGAARPALLRRRLAVHAARAVLGHDRRARAAAAGRPRRGRRRRSARCSWSAAAIEGVLNPVLGRLLRPARAAAADPGRAGGRGRDGGPAAPARPRSGCWSRRGRWRSRRWALFWAPAGGAAVGRLGGVRAWTRASRSA